MFKNISIKARLIFVLGMLAVLLMVNGGFGLYGLSETNGNLKKVFEQDSANVLRLSDIERMILKNRIALFIATSDPSEDTIRLRTDEVEKNISEINRIWDEYVKTDMSAEDRALADDFATILPRFIQEGVRPAVSFLREGKVPDAERHLIYVLFALSLALEPRMDALMNVQQEHARQSYEASQATYSQAQLIAFACIGIGLLVATVVGFLLVRAIVNPLNEAVRVANDIANGDLTKQIQVRTRDETGKLLAAMKQMSAKLAEMVGKVSAASVSVATGAREIAAGNVNLSQRTEEQASSLEETASSMEELTSTVKQNADSARQANQLANAAREAAEKGSDVVSRAMNAMGEINASSKKVEDIIGVIDEIAFQTNLLALNAAVEAARAGEQGRGFAVVAAEVRNLAQRSATSAKEIKDLISDSVRKVDDGAHLVDQSGKTLEEIVSSVKKVTDIVAEIAAASQEQSAGIEQVSKAVMQMDEMTQQNAALVEQASAASRSMEEQADMMSELMTRFKIAGGGAVAAVAAHMAPAAPHTETKPGAGKERKLISVRMPSAAHRGREPVPARDDEPSMPSPAARVNGRVNGNSAAEEWQEF
ncbi:MAG: Tar ligand binding domain-containing protein [Gammaproteobacteria bacterium]|nr:Tar ligand binding domain-containing protein [Gammaproteobacteria bacterium]